MIKQSVKDYWVKGHTKYLSTDWIDKPTVFATEAIKFFPAKGKLLDLGAGQGQDSRFFCSKGFDVLCTDGSEYALKIAETKAKNEGLDLKIQKVDLTEPIPFDNNCFDVVYSHLALHYFDIKETQVILEEIKRILKPHGIFATLLNSEYDPEVREFEKVGDNLYFDPKGLHKSYWTSETWKKMVKNDFKIILADDKGKTYKDKIKVLVRFIGEKY